MRKSNYVLNVFFVIFLYISGKRKALTEYCFHYIFNFQIKRDLNIYAVFVALFLSKFLI